MPTFSAITAPKTSEFTHSTSRRASFRFPICISLLLPLAGALPPSATAAEPEVIQLEPVVVTVGRGDTPLRIVTDPKAAAQPVPAHDGADVLKNIPGFAVIRKGGTDGDPVLRGLAGSRLGILIDGEAIYGGCGNRMDPPTAYVFPAAYDRITVVKGPQSVLHGPGNSAGVVLFQRERSWPATRTASLFTSATAGGFGRLDAALDARAAAPLAQVRFAATATRSDAYADGAGRTVHSAYRRWSANASAAWTPAAGTALEVSAARSDGEAAYADRAMDGVTFARENYAVRFVRSGLTPLLASIEARYFHNDVDHVMDNYSLRRFAPSAMMPGRTVSNPDRLTTGGLAQVVLTPAVPLRLTLGLDAQRNVHATRSTSNEDVRPFAAQSRVRDAAFRQAGAFGEAALTLRAGQRLYAGGRLDHWRATDHRAAVALSMMSEAPNPGAGHTRTSTLGSGFARYERDLAGTAATAFAGLGRVQRFPDYWESIRNEGVTHVTAFGVAPETTTQLDVGTLYRRGPLQFTVSAFAAQLDNYLLVQSRFMKAAVAPAMGGMGGTPAMAARSATVTRNVDAATWGGEADLAWRFADRWTLDASLAWVRGRNVTDALPLAQLPPLESRLGLAYRRPAWSAGALVRLVAAQNRIAPDQGNIVGQDLGRSPGFAVLALNASWRVAKPLRVSAGVDNVLDRAYAEHISRAGGMVPGFLQTTRVNEPGRFFWMKLDLSL